MNIFLTVSGLKCLTLRPSIDPLRLPRNCLADRFKFVAVSLTYTILKLSESQPLGAVVSAPFWMPCGLGSDPTTAESHELATHGKRAEVGMNETVDWSPIEPRTWHLKKTISHENDDSEKKTFGSRFRRPVISLSHLRAFCLFLAFYCGRKYAVILWCSITCRSTTLNDVRLFYAFSLELLLVLVLLSCYFNYILHCGFFSVIWY